MHHNGARIATGTRGSGAGDSAGCPGEVFFIASLASAEFRFDTATKTTTFQMFPFSSAARFKNSGAQARAIYYIIYTQPVDRISRVFHLFRICEFDGESRWRIVRAKFTEKAIACLWQYRYNRRIKVTKKRKGTSGGFEMKIDAVSSGNSSAKSAALFDFEESWKLRRNVAAAADRDVALEKEAALEKVEETREANTKTTLQMMDRHNEMVEKSQKLNREKEKRRAIERQSQEQRDEQRALLAEMALRSAERRDLFEADRLRKE
jgi:hypothetical protein